MSPSRRRATGVVRGLAVRGLASCAPLVRLGIPHTLRVLHAAALSAARCAAGPHTRRDDRPPGLPARAAIYPRKIRTQYSHAHYPGGAMGTSRPTAITPRKIRTQYSHAHYPGAARCSPAVAHRRALPPLRTRITRAHYAPPVPVVLAR